MSASFVSLAAAAAQEHPDWHWYAIADAAQDTTLPMALASRSATAYCLLGAEQGSPLAAKAPHLVALNAPDTRDNAWLWIARHASKTPAVTVLASVWDRQTLLEHFVRFTEAVLPDGEDMILAFWDPAILGTLVGQFDDETLHVPGPVLNPEQRSNFLAPLAAWCYWDRDAQQHSIDVKALSTETAKFPLRLDQAQVDALVEASVPDHLLHYIDLNQPQLLAQIPKPDRYATVRKHLLHARQLGIDGMGDMLNFVCAGFLYKETFHTDPTIAHLLEQVGTKGLTLDQAMDQFP